MVLDFINPTAEGYVSVTNGDKFNYVYNYTDHLGNIRLSYTKDPSDGQLKILEENHYYPFGLKHSNYNNDRVEFDKDENGGIFAVLRPVDRSKYQYKYNGKEFQDELNLNWYDYHARNYDPALGRWMNVDPLAETSRRFSPYTYALNNPVSFIDPDGMEADDWKKTATGDYVYDANLTKENASTQLGEGEKYIGESASISVNDTKSGNEVGNVNLNANGSASFTSTDGQVTEFNDMTVDMGFDSGNKIMAGNYQNGDVFDKGNYIAGVAAVAGEYTPGSFRFGTSTQGLSPKYYGNNWGGNQYAKTFNIGNIGKFIGTASFVIGVGADIYGVSTGTTSVGKAGLNTTMGALGFTVWGTPASLLYGAMEAFHPQGAAGALRDYNQVQSDYRKQNNGAVFKPGL